MYSAAMAILQKRAGCAGRDAGCVAESLEKAPSLKERAYFQTWITRIHNPLRDGHRPKTQA
jgi:hypothetical protein